jgi:hypothetical protein
MPFDIKGSVQQFIILTVPAYSHLSLAESDISSAVTVAIRCCMQLQ